MTLTNARFVTFGDGQKTAVIIDHSNEFLMMLCACYYIFLSKVNDLIPLLWSIFYNMSKAIVVRVNEFFRSN